MNYKEELQFEVRQATINDLPDYVYSKCLPLAKQGKTSCIIFLDTKELIDNLGESFNVEYFKIKDCKFEEFRNFRDLKRKIVEALKNHLEYEIVDVDAYCNDRDHDFSFDLKMDWS